MATLKLRFITKYGLDNPDENDENDGYLETFVETDMDVCIIKAKMDDVYTRWLKQSPFSFVEMIDVVIDELGLKRANIKIINSIID